MAGTNQVKMAGKSDEALISKIILILSRIIAYTMLIVTAIICLFFFYLLFVNATRSNAQLQAGFTLLPKGHFFDNLKNAWTDSSINIPRGMLNSFIIAAISAVLTTYFSALTAYGIHCYDFRLKGVVFKFIMAIMMIPPQVSAVGFIKLCNTRLFSPLTFLPFLHEGSKLYDWAYSFDLTNNYLPLILPGIAAPVVFFYMKQYMEATLPLEIVEAARVDGSGEFHTFNRIIIPIMMPAIAVQLIFSFVQSWNNFFIPSMIIDKPELRTVPMQIANLRSADFAKFDLGKVYMFILLAIFPVLLTYFALSKFIIKGVSEGSVKG